MKPYPFNGATDVSSATDLVWERSSECSVNYDVYFGTSSNPPFIGSQSHSIYDPGKLKADTTYYWRVDAKSEKMTNSGPLYHFTTGSASPQGDRPCENGEILLADFFENPDDDWLPVYLSGSSGGSYSVSGGKMNLRVRGTEVIYGLYHRTPVKGHFYVEVDYDIDNFAGLALIRQKDGHPDTDNYVMMSVGESDGIVDVAAHDRQDGKSDVLGSRYGVPADHYRVRLDGSQFSVPFAGTGKHFRIMHEALWGSFRYLFKVKAVMKGNPAEGWLETWGSPDWSADPADQSYYVALLLNSGASPSASVNLSHLRVMRKPTEDRDDTSTGFAVTQGEYNWSGFFGDATVVTFGDEFPYANDDRKFVFWKEANDTPHWHINNQALYFNEFIETWEDLATYPNLLCFEPMSDRLSQFSKVEIIEDNSVRKVVRWSYIIVDPDYRYPGDPAGVQAAEARETYTFYRDGTITRQQRYTPKLDNGIIQQGNEVQETIVAAGSKTWYPDLIAHPSTAIYNLEGDIRLFHPNSGTGDINSWNQFITSMNLYDGIAPFVAYSTDPKAPDVFPYPIKLGVHTVYNISEERKGAAHWPVQKAPYENAMWSQSYLTSEASSWSFSSAGNWAGNPDSAHWDLQFQTTYLVDERGRKYREWVSLVGLADVGDLDTPKSLTRSWLFPGSVMMVSSDSTFIGNNRHEKCLVFSNTSLNGILKFSLISSATTINPAIEVQNWGGNAQPTVIIAGNIQSLGVDYVSAMQGSSLLIWIHKTFTAKTNIEISCGIN